MRYLICGNCQKANNANNVLEIDNVNYCEDCLKEHFPDEQSLKGKKIVKVFDPTVCFSCSHDAGDIELPKLGEYPVCQNCTVNIQNRVLPTWVKAFFGGVVILVIFSLVSNWRFIRAHREISRLEKMTVPGDLKQTQQAWQKISEDVPEVNDFFQLAEFYRGLVLLQEDKGEEALKAFQNCTALPKNYNIDQYILQAQTDITFDKKNFVGFVEASQKLLAYDTSAISFARVASAYSCLYAQNASDSVKDLSRYYLLKAAAANDTTKDFAQYVNLIEYRLATRDAIEREQFEAKFPNGWTSN